MRVVGTCCFTSENVTDLTTIPVADDRGRRIFSHTLRVGCNEGLGLWDDDNRVTFVSCSADGQAEYDKR